MSQSYNYPSSSNVTLTGSTNGLPIPNNSIVIGGENPSGDTQPLQTDASGALIVSPLSSSSTVTAVQPNGALLHTTVDASALPSGASTSANQTTEINLLTARLSGSLVPAAFDEIDLTYVAAGNGAGQVQTAIYKLATVTIKTLTLGYNASNQLTSVVAS